jgi:type IV pilus assembly protein PilO
MKEMEFRKVMKALPEKKEIPSLLTSISQSGQDTGVEFALFEPKAEVAKEFYAEIPVEMEMSGGFHSTVMFFDKVTSLNRIVNIRNISMTIAQPTKDDEKAKLKTKCQAVTYKFIEPGEAQAAGPNNAMNKPKTKPAPPSK